MNTGRAEFRGVLMTSSWNLTQSSVTLRSIMSRKSTSGSVLCALASVTDVSNTSTVNSGNRRTKHLTVINRALSLPDALPGSNNHKQDAPGTGDSNNIMRTYGNCKARSVGCRRRGARLGPGPRVAYHAD